MSISEVKVGSLIRVKVGRNIILAKVVEILDGAVRVCSLANNKEFNVPQSRVQLDEQEAAGTEAQVESTVQTEEASTEQQSEQEPATQTEQTETTAETAAQEAEAPDDSEPATVEVVPENEAAEFTPSGEDEED